MLENKPEQQLPFSVSSHGEDITISQHGIEILLCPRSAEVLIEILQAFVNQKARDQAFANEDFNLPTESQVRQQTSYLFGGNRDALSDKEQDLYDIGGEG